MLLTIRNELYGMKHIQILREKKSKFEQNLSYSERDKNVTYSVILKYG